MNQPAHFPADLVEAYRRLARSREQDWHQPSYEAACGYGEAARAIRIHPFWRTLPARDVAEAARLLRELSVRPSRDRESPVVPYLPLEKDPDVHARRNDRVAPDAWTLYAERLDAAGMWDRLPQSLRAQERRNVERTGGDLRHGLDYRDRQFFADAEHLYELGVMSMLDELAPSLAECGLALDVVALSDPYRPPPPGGEDAYILEINGARCAVWSAEDDLGQANGWHYSLVRPLVVINELLEAAGARERLYAELAADCVYLLPQAVRAVLVDPCLGRWSPSGLQLMERSLWWVAD